MGLEACFVSVGRSGDDTDLKKGASSLGQSSSPKHRVLGHPKPEGQKVIIVLSLNSVIRKIQIWFMFEDPSVPQFL